MNKPYVHVTKSKLSDTRGQRKYLYATDGKLERDGNDKCNRCAVKMTIRIMRTHLYMTDDKRWVAFRGKGANYLRGNMI